MLVPVYSISWDYGYPTVAFFDENANYLAPIVGYHNVQQMEFI